MSVVLRSEEYITTLWHDEYSIRAKWTLFESDVYVVVDSKAALRQAIQEIGGVAVDNVDDTCNEIWHALGKGTNRSN